MQGFEFHKLKDEIGAEYFSDESIDAYLKHRIKCSENNQLSPFDYNVFDGNKTSLFNYAIINKNMGLLQSFFALTEATEAIFPFIKYTDKDYPIHTICRLGDYEIFKMFCEVYKSNIKRQFENLKNVDGDLPFETLSNPPDKNDPNKEKIKAGKIKIASYIASNYPECIATTHIDEYEQEKPFVQHVKDKGFPEIAIVIEAHETTRSK